MSNWGKFDIRQFEAFKKRLDQLNAEQLDAFCRAAAKELAARLLRKAVMRTPVGVYPKSSGKVGGTLRRNWNIDADIQQDGDTYTVTIFNPTEYASYVEYGHRTRSGGWVQGRFMMTKAEIEMQKQSPAILERKLEKMLSEVFNGK